MGKLNTRRMFSGKCIKRSFLLKWRRTQVWSLLGVPRPPERPGRVFRSNFLPSAKSNRFNPSRSERGCAPLTYIKNASSAFVLKLMSPNDFCVITKYGCNRGRRVYLQFRQKMRNSLFINLAVQLPLKIIGLHLKY
jgi:hypothetical protein